MSSVDRQRVAIFLLLMPVCVCTSCHASASAPRHPSMGWRLCPRLKEPLSDEPKDQKVGGKSGTSGHMSCFQDSSQLSARHRGVRG